MDFKSFANAKKLIICDIQPAYSKFIHFMDEFAEFVNSYGDVLVLFNGPDFGYEGKAAIAKFYWQHGVSREKMYLWKWHEKNYNWIRDPMDACWERGSIIKIIQYMLRKKMFDVRQLTREDVKKIGVSELVFSKIEDNLISIPDLYRILPRYNGADICGGSRHECLDEVMILSEALRLKFNIIRKFTYGG